MGQKDGVLVPRHGNADHLVMVFSPLKVDQVPNSEFRNQSAVVHICVPAGRSMSLAEQQLVEA